MLSRTRVAPARRHGRSALIRRYATPSASGRNLRNVLYSIFLITLPVLFVHQAHATASTINISITDSVALDITSISTTGTFATSDTSTNNISVSTNNGTGYTLGIKAKTNNSNALINNDDTSKTIPSITTSISEATYASDSTYNNTWGLRPSKLNSAVNTNYIAAPTSSSTLTTLDKTTSANPSTANNYNLAIGARVNSSTAPGSYSNVFVITATANPIPYTITYNKNTTDTVTNMPANTSSQTYDETVNISDQVPARDGFNFKGWCTTQTADGGTCSGTTYNPDGGGTDLAWTLDQTASSNSLNLYAMWAQSITLQDMTFADCPTDTAKSVSDARDGESYKVQVLADGNCWMLDNLRLDLTNSTVLNGLTTSNTHVDSASLTSLKSGNRSAGAQYASSGFVKWDSSSPDNESNQAKANADYKDTTTTSYGAGSGKIGVYYNYCAASAGSYCYDYDVGTGNASYDLCPAGWRMPTGGDSGEYGSLLYTAYSSNPTNFKNALSTPLSGYFDSGSAGYRGTIGYFWSSTYYDAYSMYTLYVNSSSVDPSDCYDRYLGHSVRCVKTPPKYMQEVDQWKDQLTTGEQVKAIDKRDGHEYWVAKQADGNIWMTQNLDLDIGGSGVAALTSENTDLNVSGAAPYDTAGGYTSSGGVITWSPASTAYPSGRVINGTTVTGWTNDENAPYSAEGGDRYYYTTGAYGTETMQTLAQCTAAGHSEEDCAHYHSGNYYNWTAAIASNASSGISTQYAVAANSICPKGWKLPQGRSSTAGDAATRQFGNLWYTSGIITSVSGLSYARNGFINIRTAPLYFVRGGDVSDSSLNDGGYFSAYWSSSVYSTSNAYNANFGGSNIYSANSSSRSLGLPIRCMVR